MRLSRRLSNLPPYLFAQLDAAARRARERGVQVISLGIGDPDQDPPLWIRELLAEEVKRSGNHRYPSYKGHPAFGDAARRLLARRYGVADLSPEHICTTIGSKEALANLVTALIDPGDAFIAPDPLYPVFATVARMAGARGLALPLVPANHYRPDPREALAGQDLRGLRAMYVNYPHNPTGAVASRAYLQSLVDFAREQGIAIVADMAYGELYYDPSAPPVSLLECAGALDCVIELHSFSKSFNMTGWRVGFAAGNPELIAGLVKVKSQVDSGVFNAIQLAMACALDDPRCDDFLQQNRAVYQARRDLVCAALNGMGIACDPPQASIYVWAPLPAGERESIAWCARLLEATGVVVSPGAGYGAHGEGFFRISLSTPDAEIAEALERLARFVRM